MKRIRRLGNKGFSLLELLIAVAILGVIVTPLLRSFVISARISKKSNDVGKATQYAENIAEMLEAADLRSVTEQLEIVGGTERLAEGTTTYTIPADADSVENKKKKEAVKSLGNALGAGDIKLQSVVRNDNTGVMTVSLSGDGYNVVATLDPKKGGTSKMDRLINNINNIPVTQYSSLDSQYLQNQGDLDPDLRAIIDLKGVAEADAAQCGAESEMIGDAPSRRITIEVIDGGPNNYEISCTYRYWWGYKLYQEDAAGTRTDLKTVKAEDNECVIPPSLVPTGTSSMTSALNPLYIFYTFSPSAMGREDAIEIYHLSADQSSCDLSPMDIFICPQVPTSAMLGRYSITDNPDTLLQNYKGLKIELKESSYTSTSAEKMTSIHVNGEWVNQFDRYLNSGDGYTDYDFKWIDSRPTEFSNRLVSEAEDRMYSLTVSVYLDTDTEKTNPIFTLEGTKLR